MQEPRSRFRSTPAAGSTNGGAPVPREPVDPLDRSDLLRRSSCYPFVLGEDDQDGIRLRRERRVFGSFSGIRRLARRQDR